MTMEHCQIQFREGLGLRPDDPLFLAELQQLQGLLQDSAFWAADRCLEDLATAIAHSKPVFSVWNGERLIGFGRATSDGVYRATIWDVVIHPSYRGNGLGRRLVEIMLAHPHLRRVERVYLMTTHQQHFYERLGFQKNSSTTMVLCHQSSPLKAVSSGTTQRKTYKRTTTP